MTIADLKKDNLILLECISGSKAYGLEIATSDTDIRGVFYLPRDQFYGLNYIPQVADATNDTVYYELGRFIELLGKNNPNILELLATPADKTLVRHPIMDEIKPELFLSKKCKDAFGGYAFTQVKKATGLNKKIMNPMGKRKKSILEFCYVLRAQGSIVLSKWLEETGRQQENIGLVSIPHFRDTFGLYYDELGTKKYAGVMKKEAASMVLLSSIPKQEAPISHLHFNQDGYTKYCKDYKEYWNWVEKRNEARYQNTIDSGKNYDAKNMMHTFRLLDMAIEILRDGKIRVERPNREELLSIRRGERPYDDLLREAEEKMRMVEQVYEDSSLPPQPNMNEVNALLVNLREQLYGGSSGPV